MTTREVFNLKVQRCLHAIMRWRYAIVLLFGAYCTALVTDWLQIRNSLEPSDFERHLRDFPLSPFAGQARAKLEGMTEWQRIAASNNLSELKNFLEEYPGSLYEQFVRLRITRLSNVASKLYTPVIPNSLNRTINGAELEVLNCDQLWTARTEIFYILGYCFVSDDSIAVFHTGPDCPYKDCKTIQKFNSIVNDEIVSNIQRLNIDAIVALEKKKGCRISQINDKCLK